MCHAAGSVEPMPADHTGRTNDTCTACHKLSPGISGTPAGTATPSAGATVAGGPMAIPHDITGALYQDCTTCHGLGKMKPFPANHASYTTTMCTSCHQPAQSGAATGTDTTAPVSAAPAVPANHDLTSNMFEGNCLACHAAGGIKPFPASHATYTVDTCTTCHKPAEIVAPTPTGTPTATPTATATTTATTVASSPASSPVLAAGTATPSAGATVAGGPMAIPHDITGALYQDCTTCHGLGKMKPFPANHASYTITMCTSCHQPAQSGAATGTDTTAPVSAAPAVPANHDLTSTTFEGNCLTCHAAGGIKPFPASHATYTVDTCTTCHKPAS